MLTVCRDFLTSVFFVWCLSLAASMFGQTHFAHAADTPAYEEIDWVALMPEDDLSALMNRPEFLNDIADGSTQDSVDNFKSQMLEDEQAQRYQSALSSTRVIDAFNGKAVRIPGFIVPLEQNENQEATTFFIVPYFGACLHMPPPPPNQILFVEFNEGIEVENLYDPFWFEGTLAIEQHESALGTSAYSLDLHHFEYYEE